MELSDKTIEELEACEAKIQGDLQKKHDEKTLSEGGFRCPDCGKVHPRDHESRYYSGLCHDDGYKRRLQELREKFKKIENFNQPTEIRALRFHRMQPGGNYEIVQGEAAVVEFLILKIGDKFAEIGIDYPDDPDFDDVKITMTLHDTCPALPSDVINANTGG